MQQTKRRRNLNILIVEDNIGDARLIEELLKGAQIGEYEITFVPDTSDISQFAKLKFDIVLLDLHLSDMTPIQTYKTVYRYFTKTPIVVLTGLEDDALAGRIVRMGAQDYLIKGTFGPSTLRRTIRYSIERKKSQLRLARVQSRSRQLQVHANDLEDETRRLEAINKAKDVFLSIASHQLRTPATSIKQYLGMLLEGYNGELTADQRHFVETAYQSNERQIKIVDDLLKVAKLDAGQVTLHKEPTDLNLLIKRVIDDQAQTFKIRKQKVDFRPLDKVVVVDIDRNNMQMVFENLLDNAGKYSPEGKTVRLIIKQTGQKIVVEFCDEGIGISASDRDKLFQKFSRIGDSFKYSPNGSGLGLYWAHEIVKLHGGAIQVNSKLAQGTTFAIELPYKLTDQPIPKAYLSKTLQSSPLAVSNTVF